MPDRKRKILEAARELCASSDSRLLYLTLFGSELYGTSTGSSDTDARGIFLPSPESVILGNAKKSLHYSTGKNDSRNNSGDMDIDLWSVGNWTRNLLPCGDIGALDLLFSVTHTGCVIYRDDLLDLVFANPLKFLDLAHNRSYAEYSLGQAKKYGIKGSRLGAIKNVWQWLEKHGTEGRLAGHINAIVAECGHGQYCFAKESAGELCLVLCGKIHVGGIGMEEFRGRVLRDMEKYGSRARDAEKNQGVDYKAPSHALRALDQMEELLLTGKIIFPLAGRERLKRVKRGEIPWTELEGIILERLAEVDRLYAVMATTYNYDPLFADNFLLSCYGLARTISEGEMPRIIVEELRKIEKSNNAHILFAVEAGSRAWGFPSLDSDYDIRFIYAHDREWYLGAAPDLERDVIEVLVNRSGAELDMAGWELRKALKLCMAGNPQIAEWLFSPIIYKENGTLAALLRNVIASCLSQGGMWRHYEGLLKSAFKRINAGDHSAKTLLYAIRPLLILNWLEKKTGLPPVPLADLIAGIVENKDTAKAIARIVERKKFSLEKNKQPGSGLIMQWLEKEWNRLEKEFPELDWSRKKPDINAIFRKVLREAHED